MSRILRRLHPNTWSVRTIVTIYLTLGIIGIVGGAR